MDRDAILTALVRAWSRPCCWNRTTNRQSGARYVTLETIAPMGDDPVISLPAEAT